jgi:eukaryotic-like serine/threonine-protein kinase
VTLAPASWPEVDRILAEVMDLPQAERAARIRALCAGNSALQAEVESLLRAHEESASFLEQAAPSVPELPITLIGRRIGAYELCQAIGTGGMGTVYRAERIDGRFQKQVAIKVAFAALHSAELLRRFAVEQQILATLDHPNISRLLDAGVSTEGIPYLIMEYVDGMPIDRYCRMHELSVRERILLFQHVCFAVNYAHQHQVAHRDIKPSNILVTAGGRPKLLDFGIAKIVDQWRNSAAEAAQSVLVPMTPDYASPEQARGEAVTTATDIYSLGVVLYEVLTGQRPYEVATKSLNEAVRTISEVEPEKPTAVVRRRQQKADPNAALAEPSPQLDAIVGKAMRKQPEERYASVQEFLSDLTNYLEGSPVKAQREERTLGIPRMFRRVQRRLAGGQPGSSIRKRYFIIGLVAAVAFALALTVAYKLVAPTPYSPQPASGKITLAVLPFENLTGNSAQDFLADGFTGEMISRLAELNYDRLGVIARTSSMSYKGTAKSVPEIGQELHVDYLLEGSVRNWGSRVRISARLIQVNNQKHLWAEMYDRRTDDILSLESDVAKAIAREINVTLAPHTRERLSSRAAVNPEAYAAYLRGRYFWNQRTEEGMKKGIDYFNQAIEREPSYAAAYVGLADCYSLLALRGTAPAREVFPKARVAVEKALALDHELGEGYATLGHLRLHDWDWAGLDQDFKRALDLAPGDAIAYRWYSEYLMTVGKTDESIAVVKQAARIDPVSPIVGTTLPRADYFAGKFDEAMDLLRKDLEIDPNHFFVHLRLGQVYLQKRLHLEAIDEMKKAVALSGRSSETLAGLAQAYAAAQMPEAMEKVLRELTGDPKQRYFSSYEVAKAYACVPNRQQSFVWLEKAYQQHDPDLIELRAEPMFAGFRSDRRFRNLLVRVGWPDSN